MSESLTTLIGQLRDPDPNARSRAVLSLGNQHAAVALDTLMDALRTEPDPNVQEDITWSLVRIGDAAVPPLIQALGDGDPRTRHYAAHTLGKIGASRATDALIRALDDSDQTVVLKTAFVLGQLGDARAIPALVQKLDHANQSIQSTVVEALEAFGRAAVPHLIEALAAPRQPVREHAAVLLGLSGDRSAIPALSRALHDTDRQVRLAAVTALGDLGGPDARAALEPLAADSDPQVRPMVNAMLSRMRR